MNFTPLGDRIVVQREETETVTRSGILIPDTARKDAQKGEVLAVGPGPRSPYSGETATMGIAVGDTVVYSPHAGLEMKIEDVDVLVLRETDIVGVVNA